MLTEFMTTRRAILLSVRNVSSIRTCIFADGSSKAYLFIEMAKSKINNPVIMYSAVLSKIPFSWNTMSFSIVV